MFFDSYPAWSSAQEGSKSEKKVKKLWLLFIKLTVMSIDTFPTTSFAGLETCDNCPERTNF